MSRIVLESVTKQYPDGTTAVQSLNLHVDDGELLVLVGPSGCGKTTALRMVAGLEEITGGDHLHRRPAVNNVAPKDRDIAMVFQSYALYPHMSVYDNMAFGLKLRKVRKAEIKQRVAGGRAHPWTRAPPAAQAAAALRRPAAAGGAGPRHRAAAAGLPDGRAAVQPRRQAAGRRRAPRSRSCSARSARPRST